MSDSALGGARRGQAGPGGARRGQAGGPGGPGGRARRARRAPGFRPGRAVSSALGAAGLKAGVQFGRGQWAGRRARHIPKKHKKAPLSRKSGAFADTTIFLAVNGSDMAVIWYDEIDIRGAC